MKFTSEDLLKAMGLKVGDKINLGKSVFEILNRNKNIICSKCDKELFMYAISLVELVDRDYTIIQPKPTLTEDEKVILKNIPKECKWIARDGHTNENRLYAYPRKPNRLCFAFESQNGYKTLSIFDHLFQFIKWEDEPYSIEELLKEN